MGAPVNQLTQSRVLSVPSVEGSVMSLPKPGDRDLRLDLFRGLALWLIFLDHIPSNIVNWVTIRNYGFSDATEIFVFISGYTAAFVYGLAMHWQGTLLPLHHHPTRPL